MTVLFAGGRLDSINIVAGAPYETPAAGYYDSAYCDAALVLLDAMTADAIQRDASGPPVSLVVGDTGYYHFEFRNSVGIQRNPISVIDEAGNAWLAIRTIGTASTSNMGVFYNSGTAAAPVWTQIGTSGLGMAANTLYAVDIKVTLGSPHSVEVFINGASIISGTFTQSLFTTARGLRFIGPSSNSWCVSQILITKDRPTIGAKVKYLRPTGAGGNSGWTGAYTNVNEASDVTTSSDITSAAGNRQTYVMGDVTVPANYVIASVFHGIRAKNDGVSPLNIKSVVRQGTTNYDFATNAPGIGLGYGPLLTRYDADPATGVSWTQTGINSAEFGYLSQA